MKRRRSWLPMLVAACLLAGCSSTKHVPDGKRLLSHARIDLPADADVKASELNNYLRQKPNARTLGILPMRLHTYSLSGADTTKWYNRWLRRLGEPPVIYSDRLTSYSARQLRQALINRGYMQPDVKVDTLHRGLKKIDLTYHVTPGDAHKIASISREYEDSVLAYYVGLNLNETMLRSGDNLDMTTLDAERTRITNALQRHGYYAFSKDKISFRADTVAGSHNVGLTLHIADRHTRYTIRRVIFQPGYEPGQNDSLLSQRLDTIPYGNIYIIRSTLGEKSFISLKILESNNWIQPGKPYNSEEFNRTYEALGRLGIVRSITVALNPVKGTDELDAIVRLTRNSLQGITVELEGTNSEGDLGAGVGVTYQHRNLFRGSETLTVKARGSYESLSGNLEGLINNHYTEGSAEVALTLPKFSAPFLSRNYKRRMLASTEFSINGNYQERPEYTRVIAGAGWRYKWSNRRNNNRRIFDLVDVSYVFLPRSTINFLDEVAGGNPLLRYSYEDHFIMRMGYSTFLTNKRVQTPVPGVNSTPTQRLIWTFRGSAEIAGNLLYAISNLTGQHKHDGAYKIFGTQYAQYAKAEGDYMISRRLTQRTSLAFRAGAGLAVPYGNSSMVPFEKRFYAGGANSVRGWSVRTLGPGRYDARNTMSNFINQCGDIRLDLNVEARCKLFWVIESALFIDGGNVWTIRNYENQPGGQFSFRTFAQEIAWAYGAGIRLDFTYFLVRLDLGMKAYNPAMNQERWPLTHPDWGRDATFHFSVGYPF